ncbi:hypothetical protein ASG06_17585 [Rathayibacter sp. Leaf185]|nr:hypothetical protein ASF42_18795 [Rathayibacter sp. Leaf294]KQS08551.1 hypothetical protein ASG06_17585 [Rathayibacter sp. Leaf185]
MSLGETVPHVTDSAGSARAFFEDGLVPAETLLTRQLGGDISCFPMRNLFGEPGDPSEFAVDFVESLFGTNQIFAVGSQLSKCALQVGLILEFAVEAANQLGHAFSASSQFGQLMLAKNLDWTKNLSRGQVRTVSCRVHDDRRMRNLPLDCEALRDGVYGFNLDADDSPSTQYSGDDFPMVGLHLRRDRIQIQRVPNAFNNG